MAQAKGPTVDPSHAEYAEEARERWGQTDAWRESVQRTRGYSEDDWARIRAESDAGVRAHGRADGRRRAPDVCGRHGSRRGPPAAHRPVVLRLQPRYAPWTGHDVHGGPPLHGVLRGTTRGPVGFCRGGHPGERGVRAGTVRKRPPHRIEARGGQSSGEKTSSRSIMPPGSPATRTGRDSLNRSWTASSPKRHTWMTSSSGSTIQYSGTPCLS